jgi:hypothetical protein
MWLFYCTAGICEAGPSTKGATADGRYWGFGKACAESAQTEGRQKHFCGGLRRRPCEAEGAVEVCRQCIGVLRFFAALPSCVRASGMTP